VDDWQAEPPRLDKAIPSLCPRECNSARVCYSRGTDSNHVVQPYIDLVERLSLQVDFRFASTDPDQRQAHQSPIMSTKFLQRVVRNDAMKSDPPEIYGWRVYALAVSACFGGMIFVSASRSPKAENKSSCCS
jgi:hypothetical protein